MKRCLWANITRAEEHRALLVIHRRREQEPVVE
jgi:hypothetical protein